MEKVLGKITKVSFGIGGNQDVCIGLHLTIDTTKGTVNTSISTWDPEMVKCDTKHTHWTEKERNSNLSDILRYVSKLLNEAKVKDVSNLKGVPVEVTFDGNMLK